MMKAELPKPVHESYIRHRRQRTTQIFLPVGLAVLFCISMIVLIYLSTSRGSGDVSRWAALSTVWIAMLVFIMGFVSLVLLAGMVYLFTLLLGIAPVYTGRAQVFVRRLALRIQRMSDMAVKPIFSINEFGATIRALFGKK